MIRIHHMDDIIHPTDKSPAPEGKKISATG